MARSGVVYETADGRGILSITPAQATLIDRLMRRYYAWVAGGRKYDPWQSGVAHGTRFDRPRVQNRSNGSFGPGKYSEAELPEDLVAIDAILKGCTLLDQTLFRWHWSADDQFGRPLRVQEMLDRLGVGLDSYKSDWRKARVRLYCKVAGL